MDFGVKTPNFGRDKIDKELNRSMFTERVICYCCPEMPVRIISKEKEKLCLKNSWQRISLGRQLK